MICSTRYTRSPPHCNFGLKNRFVARRKLIPRLLAVHVVTEEVEQGSAGRRAPPDGLPYMRGLCVSKLGHVVALFTVQRSC